MIKKHKQKTVSLVLGSGGAKGLTHIGVIRWLEEHNYKIESISGSSIGALVGGIYAAGQLDVYEKWVRAISKFDLMVLMDISWDKGGFIKGDKIINSLEKLVGQQNIEDLPINFTAITTDIDKEKEIWINKGDLFTAIRASISIPMIFTPYTYKGKRVIDGGILNPVPIAPTFVDDTDLTIAVNLGGATEYPKGKPGNVKMMREISASPFKKKIHRFVASLTKNKPRERHNWDAYDVANHAIDAMQSQIARHRLAASPPNVLIEIPRNACGTMEFSKANEMIALGYERAEQAMSLHST
ncbi:patatin-like phospholipase family protein [Thalassotalea nanhaiensis]|uniref:Patatin-like phospholipase family protein n=1 Tax=Thalassotalea nanhaiensis TaxID=3065648 RepID=A0ABY9TJV5_9GAMM|nr:patatin-like phospholipase family protein [Colwelliaceae bacterium SQ345]